MIYSINKVLWFAIVHKSRFWVMPGHNSRTEIVLVGNINLERYFPSCACESHLTRNFAAKSLLLDGSACSSSFPNYAHYFSDTDYGNSAKIPIFCYPQIEKAHRRGWHDSFIFCSPSDTHHFYLAFFALLRAHITNTKSHHNPSRRLQCGKIFQPAQAGSGYSAIPALGDPFNYLNPARDNPTITNI